MLYIVLGMHKSGTTAVAEILHKSGIAMDDEVDVGKDYTTGNKYERLAVQELNKAILHCAEQASLDIRVPADCRLTAEQQQRIADVVRAQETSGSDWGCKDPRMCLTYRLWKSLLPPHKLIVVYRHPVQVYLHYRHKANVNKVAKLFLVWKILQAWSLHNTHILASLRESDAPFLMISYERLMRTPQEFARLEAFIGRPLTDARKKQYYQREQQHSPIATVANAALKFHGGSPPFEIWRQLEDLRAQQCQPERQE